MGGIGSGRPKSSKRPLVEECDVLDISRFTRGGWSLNPLFGIIDEKDGKKYLEINYHTYWLGPGDYEREDILLEKTYPYFGGYRYWMICPGCSNRVKKLRAYLQVKGNINDTP